MDLSEFCYVIIGVVAAILALYGLVIFSFPETSHSILNPFFDKPMPEVQSDTFYLIFVGSISLATCFILVRKFVGQDRS